MAHGGYDTGVQPRSWVEVDVAWGDGVELQWYGGVREQSDDRSLLQNQFHKGQNAEIAQKVGAKRGLVTVFSGRPWCVRGGRRALCIYPTHIPKPSACGSVWPSWDRTPESLNCMSSRFLARATME